MIHFSFNLIFKCEMGKGYKRPELLTAKPTYVYWNCCIYVGREL